MKTWIECDYVGKPCPNCGRVRLIKYIFPDKIRHVCEKCDWCPEDEEYLNWDDYDYEQYEEYHWR